MCFGMIEMSVSSSDRLLKDIVIETCTQFEVIAFIPLLRERIYVRNAFTRQFIVSWVCLTSSKSPRKYLLFRSLSSPRSQNLIWCNIYLKLWMDYFIFSAIQIRKYANRNRSLDLKNN